MKFKFMDREVQFGEKTKICGILNVTKDSFSDGGKYYNIEDALNHAKELIDGGAYMIDVGGESTRPGSHYIEIKDEIAKTAPVIEEIKKRWNVPVSIDTWKSEVARRGIEAGADVVNDITGLLGDPEMAGVLKGNRAGLILMFNPVIARPDHPSSKIFPTFGKNPFTEEELKSFLEMDIVELEKYYFSYALKRLEKFGIEKERVVLDPGIGFGLTKKENLILIKNLEEIHKMGYLSYLGVSRKRFVQNILEEAAIENDVETEEGFKNRDIGTGVLSSIAQMSNAGFIRVHSLVESKIGVEVSNAVREAEKEEDINFGAYVNK